MRPIVFLVLWCGVAAVGSLAVGCASSKSQTKAAPGERPVLRYHPLRVGDRWVYEDSRFGQKQAMEVIVVRQEGANRFVALGRPVGEPGTRPAEVTFEVRPRGLFDGTRYILEEPLEVGHKWMAIPSIRTTERFELTSLTAMATVPAGRFSGCASVRNTVPDTHGQSTITDVTFCPGVGMVERMVRVTAPGKPDKVAYHARLTAYFSGGAQVLPKPAGE